MAPVEDNPGRAPRGAPSGQTGPVRSGTRGEPPEEMTPSGGLEKERKLYAYVHTTRRGRGFCLAAFLFAQAAAGAEPPREDWYALELDGRRAGWIMEREERRGDEIVTESTARLELRRGTAVVTLELESRFVETGDGRPLRASVVQRLGAQPIAASYRFTDDGVVVGEEGEKRPLPAGDWLTPARMQQRIREEVAGGAEDFSLRTVDPQLGLEPILLHWVLEARGEEVTAGGVTWVTSRWRQTASAQPQVTNLVHLDAEGRTIRSATTLLGMDVVQVLSTRAEVMGRPLEAPELLVSLFVRPEGAIERPRRLRRAVYEVRVDQGAPPELPSVGAQTATRDGSAARVTVEVGASSPAPDADRAELLRPTVFVPHDDPRLRALLAEAWRGGEPAGDAARAERLRAFVAGYVTEKDLDTGLATAVEVAATRSGDCTEHAVLLGALLRAAGIPSRGVFGLIYADRFAGESAIFGYHMWTQALIDGRWTDLDATLDAPFDAAHVALGTWSFEDGAGVRELAGLADLMGRLRIRVLETER